jgi:hypothetical protein
VLYVFSNAIFIITWLVACAFNKASISDMDLDPEDMQDPQNPDETLDTSS